MEVVHEETRRKVENFLLRRELRIMDGFHVDDQG